MGYPALPVREDLQACLCFDMFRPDVCFIGKIPFAKGGFQTTLYWKYMKMRDSHSHANESQPMCMICSWDCLDIFHSLQGQFLWRPRTDQATWVVMHCRGLIPTRFVGSFGLRLSAIFNYHITSSDQRFRWVLSVASTSKKVSRLFQLTKPSSWFR